MFLAVFCLLLDELCFMDDACLLSKFLFYTVSFKPCLLLLASDKSLLYMPKPKYLLDTIVLLLEICYLLC